MNPYLTRCFVADSTLGRLAKWLRLLGFDTEYDTEPPDPYRLMALRSGSRLVLTRSPGVYDQLVDCPALLIRSEDPQKQIRQSIDDLKIRWGEIRPFSRCTVCNTVVRLLSRADAAGQVPDYVFQHHTRFHQCPRCSRIYWPGSHCRHWLDITQQWFGKSSASPPAYPAHLRP